MMPSPQPAVFHPPPVSQQFAQQAVSVPVPVSDGQSFRSYMSWDQRQFEDRHSASSGRTHRALERQRPIIPRETGMLRRAAGSDAASASGAPGNRCLQHHESVMPRERSALKSNPLPGMFDAAPAEPVIERAEQRACPVNCSSSTPLPRVCRRLLKLLSDVTMLDMTARLEPVV